MRMRDSSSDDCLRDYLRIQPTPEVFPLALLTYLEKYVMNKQLLKPTIFKYFILKKNCIESFENLYQRFLGDSDDGAVSQRHHKVCLDIIISGALCKSINLSLFQKIVQIHAISCQGSFSQALDHFDQDRSYFSTRKEIIHKSFNVLLPQGNERNKMNIIVPLY